MRRRNDMAQTRYIGRKSTYTVDEAARVTGVNPATVRKWIRLGLSTLDEHRPYIISGAVLKSWLLTRQSRRRFSCTGARQMPCFSCHGAREPQPGTVYFDRLNAKVFNIVAPCPVCGTMMHKGAAMAKIEEVKATFGLPSGGELNLSWSPFPPEASTLSDQD